MVDRIPAPDKTLDSGGRPVMVLPDGTIIGNKYSIRYLNTKNKNFILYLAEKIEDKSTLEMIKSYFYEKKNF